MGLTNTAQKNAGKKAGLEDFCFMICAIHELHGIDRLERAMMN